MFEVGKEYKTVSGNTALIVATDSPLMWNDKVPCPLLAVVKMKGQKHFSQSQPFDTEGKYCGLDPKTNSSYAPYCLISDEPNVEEREIISGIRDLIEKRNGSDKDFVQLIRKLRKA